MVVEPASTSEPIAQTSNARQLPVEGACDPEINCINCSVQSGGRMGYHMWISSEKAANALHGVSSSVLDTFRFGTYLKVFCCCRTKKREPPAHVRRDVSNLSMLTRSLARSVSMPSSSIMEDVCSVMKGNSFEVFLA
jgi:hypothetical protein